MTTSAYVPTEQERTFERYHDRLRGELNNADWHFEIWKYLQNLRKDYIRELNQAPVFFSLTMRAHLLETVMRLNRMLDNPSNSMSVCKFLNFVEQNLDILSYKIFFKRVGGDEIAVNKYREITLTEIQKHRHQIDDLPKDNIRKWRDKALAHIDREYVQKEIDVFHEYPVDIKDIVKIIDTLHDILNQYLHTYNSSTWAKEVSFEGGLQYVMDSIRFCVRKGSE